jgi:hypothetical protein
MRRRGGQSGTVVKKGNWWHGRYYVDVAVSAKRARKSVAIGHCAEMTKPEARRKLAVMLHELGVNDNSYLAKAPTPVKVFSEHAEWWEANVLPMHKPSSQNSSQYILKKHLKPFFGQMPMDAISESTGGFYRSMQHHLVDVLFKDGVYERRKTVETFSHPEIRDLEPLEVRTVVA